MDYDVAPKSIDVPDDVRERWQQAINILCQLLDMPIALVMRVNWPHIEVYVSNGSNKENNPYYPGDIEYLPQSGLYCESVIKNKSVLEVIDANSDPRWVNNPDMKYGYCTYLGMPILLPDGNVFGTLCIMDNQAREFDETTRRLLDNFKALLESHLELVLNNQALSSLLNEVSTLNAKLDLASKTDPLTQLPNRSGFAASFRSEQVRMVRHQESSCLLLLDIDHFKAINDTFGHNAGDEVLIAVGHSIKSRLREYDFLWRWGGEEFLILLPNTGLKQAVTVAEDLRKCVASLSIDNIDQRTITISVGVSTLQPNESSHHSVARVDEMLYRAKAGGRNQVHYLATDTASDPTGLTPQP